MANYTIKDFDDMYNDDDLDTLYDLFTTFEICGQDALDLVIAINGYNTKTFEDILYCQAGLRSIEQLVDDLDIDPEDYNLVIYDDDEE